jgi:hypothetical protein
MPNRARRPRLSQEALNRALVPFRAPLEELERHGLAGDDVRGPPHDPHPPLAQAALQAKATPDDRLRRESDPSDLASIRRSRDGAQQAVL